MGGQKLSLTNYEARVWYSWQKSLIRSNLDLSKPLEQTAKDACNMRNTIRATARNIMKESENVNCYTYGLS